jgi:acyl dehydratase
LASRTAPSLGEFEASWESTEKSFSISQVETDVFATLVRDPDPMHNDPAWARTSAAGHTIVHGVHVLSRLASIVRSSVDELHRGERVSGYHGLDRVRFISPVPVGAQLRAGAAITGQAHLDSATLWSVRAQAALEDSHEPAIVAEFVLHVAGPSPVRKGMEVRGGDWSAAGGSGSAIRRMSVFNSEDEFRRYFHDLAAHSGEPVGATDWYQIDQPLADCFAHVCHDFRLDHEAAASDPPRLHGPREVQQFFLLALGTGLLSEVGLLVPSDSVQVALNYGYERVRWDGAAHVGVPMRNHVWLDDVRSKRAGFVITTSQCTEVKGAANPRMCATGLTYWLPVRSMP